MRSKLLVGLLTLELSCDAMKCVIIEDKVLEALSMEWQNAKMSKLEYCIANVNPQNWPRYKEKMPKCKNVFALNHTS